MTQRVVVTGLGVLAANGNNVHDFELSLRKGQSGIAVNEQMVRGALDRLASNRTTLVIAHRLSTVRGADLIVVMDRGKVVEMGTHDELLERGGMYAQLIAHQLSGATNS